MAQRNVRAILEYLDFQLLLLGHAPGCGTRLDVIHIGKETYPLTKQIRAVAFERLHEDIRPRA